MRSSFFLDDTISEVYNLYSKSVGLTKNIAIHVVIVYIIAWSVRHQQMATNQMLHIQKR